MALALEELVKPLVGFFSIFEYFFRSFSCLFTAFHLNFKDSNTFWLYQHVVINALFQNYSHLKSLTSNETPFKIKLSSAIRGIVFLYLSS